MLLKKKKGIKYRKIPRDFFACALGNTEGWERPRKWTDELSCEQGKGSAFHQWKIQTMQPRKET